MNEKMTYEDVEKMVNLVKDSQYIKIRRMSTDMVIISRPDMWFLVCFLIEDETFKVMMTRKQVCELVFNHKFRNTVELLDYSKEEN